jgi:hypothetical protein
MARVSDEPRAPNDYRWARQVSALLLIAVVVVIVLDVLVDDYDVSTAVLVPLLLTVAGLLSENVNPIWPHRDRLIWPHPRPVS